MIVSIVIIFLLLAGILGGVAYMVYRRKLRRAKAIERGLKMVPILIHLPPPSADTDSSGRDVREVMREKTAQAEVLYNLIGGTATEGFKSKFFGQRHIALELIASSGLVHFYAAVPVGMVSTVEKAIQTAYPGAKLEEVEDHNIFNQQGRLAATMGGEMVLKAESAYPIATYAQLDRDPMEAIITTLSSLGKEDGAAVQVMIRPAGPAWVKRSTALTAKLRKGRHGEMKFTALDLAKASVKAPTAQREEAKAYQPESTQLSKLELGTIEQIEDKTKHPGFEVLIRVVVSTESVARSQQLLRDLATAFALFESPGLNGFKFLPAVDVQGIVTAFIFRFFPPEIHSSILNSGELATLFHLPDSQFTPTTNVERQKSKEVDGPVASATEGLLFGYNEFRGVKKEIRLSTNDRRRHTYILGQTGTGKSTMLENLIVQDMIAGNGFAFIDPHGDSAEKLLSLVPKSRAEDVIYFNPADMEYPLGLNLFEFKDPLQKDFLIQESLNMLYKLYDPNGTGVIGPRFEQWYRNAALTLMADPNGATFIEIPKVFTDTEYLKQKFKYLKDPTVIDFWTKEMGQTSDYHKSEMLGYFVSKFGAFQQNEMMRNIIGQTKSAFDMRDIMDNKKILIVNLSKGQVGELNSKLLGMMFVIKFQAAAMSRANMPEDQRADFCLYVDEFQNFSTDSFASILSEARKYRLNLIVGNQFIGQLSPEIRDAVFGNIGTILAHRMGPEDAEFMVKQLAPVFDASDLMNIPNFHSAARLMIGGLPSQPFTMSDLPQVTGNNAELGLAIKQLSAAKFGSTKAMVEADILARLSGPGAPAPVANPVAAAEPAPATPPVPAADPTPQPVPAPEPVMPPVALTPEPAAAPPVPEPVEPPIVGPPAETAAVVVSESAPASALTHLAATPPPIGAPPVDMGPPPSDKPQPAADSSSLSIRDITGGKPVIPADQPDVELIPPGAEPAPVIPDPLADVPLLATPAPEAPAPVQSVPAAEPVAIVTESNEVVDESPALEVAPEAPLAEPEPREQPVEVVESESPETLIHFVDPKLETVLDQPEIISPTSPPAAVASATADLPLPTLSPVTEPPAISPAPGVDIAAMPPIGAPPVDLPVAATALGPVEPPAVPDVAPAIEELPADTSGRSTDDAVAAVLAAAAQRESAQEAPAVTMADSGAASGQSETPIPEVTPLTPSPTDDATPSPTPAEAVTQAEHEIDELLNVSLIHNDHASRPLPEPVESTPSDDSAPKPSDSGRHWVGGSPIAVATAADTVPEVADVMLDGGTPPSDSPVLEALSEPTMPSSHTKVIEPLEPIVEPAEEAPAPAPAEPEPATVPEPVVLPEAQSAEAPPPAPPAPPVAPDPPVTADSNDDSVLPPAVSLAAPDVAAAKAAEIAQAAVPPGAPEAVVPEPAPAPAAEAPVPDDLPEQPEPTPEAKPSVPEPAPEHSSSRRHHRSKRNHTKESAAPVAEESESMAGKLILPSSLPREVAPTAPASATPPPKLAKGEIYVDAHGNVVTGE